VREGTSACACGIEQWRIFRVSAFVDALAWVVFHRWSCQVLWWHCGGLGFSCSGGVSSRGAGRQGVGAVGGSVGLRGCGRGGLSSLYFAGGLVRYMGCMVYSSVAGGRVSMMGRCELV
jgi:hypothetical protein